MVGPVLCGMRMVVLQDVEVFLLWRVPKSCMPVGVPHYQNSQGLGSELKVFWGSNDPHRGYLQKQLRLLLETKDLFVSSHEGIIQGAAIIEFSIKGLGFGFWWV